VKASCKSRDDKSNFAIDVLKRDKLQQQVKTHLLTETINKEHQMKRHISMNRQRLVQTSKGGQWNTDKVEKAGSSETRHLQHLPVQSGRQAKPHDGVIVWKQDRYLPTSQQELCHAQPGSFPINC
jgi:hypothetical protein